MLLLQPRSCRWGPDSSTHTPAPLVLSLWSLSVSPEAEGDPGIWATECRFLRAMAGRCIVPPPPAAPFGYPAAPLGQAAEEEEGAVSTVLEEAIDDEEEEEEEEDDCDCDEEGDG